MLLANEHLGSDFAAYHSAYWNGPHHAVLVRGVRTGTLQCHTSDEVARLKIASLDIPA